MNHVGLSTLLRNSFSPVIDMETFLREIDVRSSWSVSGTALPIKAYFFQVLKLMIDFRAERLGAVERVSCSSGRGSLEMGLLGHWPHKNSHLFHSLEKMCYSVREAKGVTKSLKAERK